MFNDISYYVLRYESWYLDNSSYTEMFYREFINDEFIRFLNLNGETIDLSEDWLICTQIAVDLSPDLIPEWLK